MMAAMLIVELRGLRVALPVGPIVEQHRPLPVEPIRGAPPYVLGVSRVRGAALPVVDLGGFLSGRPGAALQRWVTVRLDGPPEGRQVVLAVDAVVGVSHVDAAAFGALPPLLQDVGALEALGARDASLMVLLRAARVLDAGWAHDADGSVVAPAADEGVATTEMSLDAPPRASP